MSFKEVHDLLGCNLLLESFLQTISVQHANDKVLKAVVFSHKQAQDRSVDQALSICIDLEVRFDYDELIGV